MKKKLLLSPRSTIKWEQGGVLNPAVIELDDTLYMIYRAVEPPNKSRLGVAVINPSTLEVEEVFSRPFMVPSHPFDREGVEDPRVTVMEGKHFLLYSAWDGTTSRIALCEGVLRREGAYFHGLRDRGVISSSLTVDEILRYVNNPVYRRVWKEKDYKMYPWNKDAVLFPKKINGRYVLLQRLEPAIQTVFFKDWSELQEKEFWTDYFAKIENYTLMWPEYEWEKSKIGAGAPPIPLEDGWLLIYHGVREDDKGKVYSAGAAWLSRDLSEVRKLREPLFTPEEPWELEGVVNNVVFPTSTIIRDDELLIFYGAADKHIGVATFSLEEIIRRIKK